MEVYYPAGCYPGNLGVFHNFMETDCTCDTDGEGGPGRAIGRENATSEVGIADVRVAQGHILSFPVTNLPSGAANRVPTANVTANVTAIARGRRAWSPERPGK